MSWISLWKKVKLAKIFALNPFKMAANQSKPGLNRILSSNFWLLRSASYVKFSEECVIYMKRHVLIKKIITQGSDLLLWARVETTVTLRRRKKFQAKQPVKTVTLGIFWDMKGSIIMISSKRWDCKQCYLRPKSRYLLKVPLYIYIYIYIYRIMTYVSITWILLESWKRSGKWRRRWFLLKVVPLLKTFF